MSQRTSGSYRRRDSTHGRPHGGQSYSMEMEMMWCVNMSGWWLCPEGVPQGWQAYGLLINCASTLKTSLLKIETKPVSDRTKGLFWSCDLTSNTSRCSSDPKSSLSYHNQGIKFFLARAEQIPESSCPLFHSRGEIPQVTLTHYKPSQTYLHMQTGNSNRVMMRITLIFYLMIAMPRGLLPLIRFTNCSLFWVRTLSSPLAKFNDRTLLCT